MKLTCLTFDTGGSGHRLAYPPSSSALMRGRGWKGEEEGEAQPPTSHAPPPLSSTQYTLPSSAVRPSARQSTPDRQLAGW
eukprot:CAMPEP_0177760994 /NCGR_PEP_ID=MMETSP0491_2-20121128/5567_1 /TAXON_ID=63592 /ORGANISM="Tetraselmis chuii, Strain PLY429" /LENGTH=79 /DNA_ID=CAMNT_0019276937 /DNA_START=218 /DNA_END=454 /DNA_ORIENTATION=+